MTQTDDPILIELTEADIGSRFDKALASQVPDLSRARLQALMAEGAVAQAEPPHTKIGDPSAKVKQPMIVAIKMPAPVDPLPKGEDIALTVVFEDEHLIVVDKPAGLVVHPGAGNETGTLVNALINHCGDSLSGIGGEKRPGIVHRIDKETSGLLVVAKHDKAHKGLSEQFAEHSIDRRYLAFVWGVAQPRRGTVDAHIGRSRTNRIKMAIVSAKHGRHAVTHYKTMQTFGNPSLPTASLMECELETGRTHQIRVHLNHIGHPLLADNVYAPGFKTRVQAMPDNVQDAIAALNGQALHAARLGFIHPVTGEEQKFESSLPPRLENLLSALKSL